MVPLVVGKTLRKRLHGTCVPIELSAYRAVGPWILDDRHPFLPIGPKNRHVGFPRHQFVVFGFEYSPWMEQNYIGSRLFQELFNDLEPGGLRRTKVCEGSMTREFTATCARCRLSRLPARDNGLLLTQARNKQVPIPISHSNAYRRCSIQVTMSARTVSLSRSLSGS